MTGDPEWTADEIALLLPNLRTAAARAAETDDVVDVHGGLLLGILDRLDAAEAWIPRPDPDARTVSMTTIHVEPPPPRVIVVPGPRYGRTDRV